MKKSVFKNFKSIYPEIESKEVSQDFWLKEHKNIIKQVRKAKKLKVQMKMDYKRFNKSFTI